MEDLPRLLRLPSVQRVLKLLGTSAKKTPTGQLRLDPKSYPVQYSEQAAPTRLVCPHEERRSANKKRVTPTQLWLTLRRLFLSRVFFVHLPIQCTAPGGEWNHGCATVRNGLTCRSVRGVKKPSPGFPVLVHSTIRVCLLATRHYDAIHEICRICLADSHLSALFSLPLSLSLSLSLSALCHPHPYFVPPACPPVLSLPPLSPFYSPRPLRFPLPFSV